MHIVEIKVALPETNQYSRRSAEPVKDAPDNNIHTLKEGPYDG
jgi:hypothetical protein